MNFPGRQVFIVDPDASRRNGLVTSLRSEEYETYGMAGKDIFPLNSKRPEIVFLYTGEAPGWDWRDFADRYRSDRKEQSSLYALGRSETPEGFAGTVEKSGKVSRDAVLSVLDSNGAKDRRGYVRFGSQGASIATFEYHLSGKRYAGVVHDISIVALSCTFLPEPSDFQAGKKQEITLNLRDYRTTLPGDFTLERDFGGQVVRIFRFHPPPEPRTRERLSDFIYSSLESKHNPG